jgi:hypothetical protein
MIILGSIFRICQPDGLTNAKLSKQRTVLSELLYFFPGTTYTHTALTLFLVLGAMACTAGAEVFDCLSFPRS